MAFIRKKLSMALGLGDDGSPTTNKASRTDSNRNSIDSGYHSMIAKSKCRSQDSLRETAFMTLGTESSPERPPKKLHKAISSTFSGAMQAFSNSVRSTTSYIYPTAGKPELPLNEWAECETPKKQSRRSSIMSSVRSRKQRFNPRTPDARTEFPGTLPSPVPVTKSEAPALDVEIPNPSFSYESLEKVSGSNGSHLLTGVKLPAGPKKLWPGPTRLTVEQASGGDKGKALHRVSPDFDDPYLEKGDRLQHGLAFNTSLSEFVLDSPSPPTSKRYMSDEKGYCSEVESNADSSGSDGLSPACLKYVAPDSPEARTNSPCSHEDPAASDVNTTLSTSACKSAIPSQMPSSVPSESEPSKLGTLDGNAEQPVSPEPPRRRSRNHNPSVEDDLDASFLSCDVITSKAKSLYKRLPSDVYDADVESLDSSMGCRAAWERHRADRERRYMEIVDMASNTESDEEIGPELELKRSPSKKSVHYAEELVQGKVDTGKSEPILKYPTGDLRFAVEAIERPAFPVGDLAYAVEAIESQSITTFDPLETVFQQRPMLRLSDAIDKPEAIQTSDSLGLTSSNTDVPLSPLVASSPSRVGLPPSPESSPVDVSEAAKSTIMAMRLKEEELMTVGAGNLEGQSIRQSSSGSTSVSANSSPEQQSLTVPDAAYEASLKAEALSVPTYSSRSSKTGSVGEDAYAAGLRAAGLSMPLCSSDIAQMRPATNYYCEDDSNATSILTSIFTETSHDTYREILEAASTLPKQLSRNGTPFEHSRTVSIFSDNTDDSCAITTHSPSCNAPLPFPSLHVRSEPARHIPSAIDALATHGDEQIRIAGPANGGLKPALPSPFDGPRNQTNEARSKILSPKTWEGEGTAHDNSAQITMLEQHDLLTPSPSNTSSVQSPSVNSTPQETFNEAKVPSFVSPSPIASRKARRKQKRSSIGRGTVPFADRTVDFARITLEPDLSNTEGELNHNSALGKRQTPLGGGARVAGGSVQKPSPNRRISGRDRRNRDTVTSSPSRKKIPRAKGKTSDEIWEQVKDAVNDSKSRSEPQFSIKHFDSRSNISSLHATGGLGDTSYAGHELDRIIQTNPPENPRQQLDKNLQQDSDEGTIHFASGDENFGNGSDSDKDDAPRTPGQKKKGKLHSEAEKKLAVQKLLERKSDRACSRLAGKLKSGAITGDHLREDDPAYKDGRPPWRP